MKNVRVIEVINGNVNSCSVRLTKNSWIFIALPRAYKMSENYGDHVKKSKNLLGNQDAKNSKDVHKNEVAKYRVSFQLLILKPRACPFFSRLVEYEGAVQLADRFIDRLCY